MIDGGLSVEATMQYREWPQDALKVMILNAGGRFQKITASERDAIGNLPMSIARNSYRAGKLLKVLGLKGIHRNVLDHQFCRRYLFALRLNTYGATSFSIGSDKSRGSGKDWLSSVVMPYETLKPGWMNPVAYIGCRQSWIILYRGYTPTSENPPPKDRRGQAPTSENPCPQGPKKPMRTHGPTIEKSDP